MFSLCFSFGHNTSVFIVLEGIDGSGTTTQSKLLSDKLASHSIEHLLTAEPTDGEVGRFIRSALSGDCQLSSRALQLLFFADREEHLQNTILPALEAQKTVVTDRYFLSTVAYASVGGDRSLFTNIAEYFLEPDLTIYLDLSPSTAIERILQRGEAKEIFEKEELLVKIAQAYAQEMERTPAEKKLIIDGTLPIAAVADLIWERVEIDIQQ